MMIPVRVETDGNLYEAGKVLETYKAGRTSNGYLLLAAWEKEGHVGFVVKPAYGYGNKPQETTKVIGWRRMASVLLKQQHVRHKLSKKQTKALRPDAIAAIEHTDKWAALWREGGECTELDELVAQLCTNERSGVAYETADSRELSKGLARAMARM